MLVWSYPAGDDTTDQIVNIVASRRGVEELVSIIANALNVTLEIPSSNEDQPQTQPQNKPATVAPVKQKPTDTTPTQVDTPSTTTTSPSTPSSTKETVTPAQEDTTTSETEPKEEEPGESILQEGSGESQLDLPMEETPQE